VSTQTYFEKKEKIYQPKLAFTFHLHLGSAKKMRNEEVDTKVSMTGLPKCTWWLRATIKSVM
jgi:hypothetical protein